MEDENNNYIGFGLFFFLIVLIVIVGSITLYRNQKTKTSSDSSQTKIIENDKLKQDKDKDFIYYTLEETVSEQLNMTIKKANINLTNDKVDTINEELDKIYDNALSSLKKSGSTENICENGSDLYSMNTLDYAVYYGDYITLLVSENEYNCQRKIDNPLKNHAYIFDAETGKIVSSTDLLDKYDLTYTNVLEILRKHLKEQNLENSSVKIDQTLNELKENENYVIYIDENKKLNIKYIVKTDSVDYNDVIELN